ncbi:MAG: 5'/3'-nucleotidase SurE, partial [Desulfobacterales bacterium]
AREAAFLGIPALAVSMVHPGAPYFSDAARFISDLLPQIATGGMPRGTFLNINLPHCALAETAGVRVRPHKTEPDRDAFEKRTDPRNRVYYWHRGFNGGPLAEGAGGDDCAALAQKYICVTPIKCDTTDYGLLKTLDAWLAASEKA